VGAVYLAVGGTPTVVGLQRCWGSRRCEAVLLVATRWIAPCIAAELRLIAPCIVVVAVFAGGSCPHRSVPCWLLCCVLQARWRGGGRCGRRPRCLRWRRIAEGPHCGPEPAPVPLRVPERGRRGRGGGTCVFLVCMCAVCACVCVRCVHVCVGVSCISLCTQYVSHGWPKDEGIGVGPPNYCTEPRFCIGGLFPPIS
jgi:hypothetical protein